MANYLRDISYAFRSIVHRPSLSATIVLSLALATGAHTLVFAVFDTVLLRPLPVREADRVVVIWNRYGTSLTHSSPPDFVDRLERSEKLASQAAVVETSMNLAGEFEARQVRAARVTSAFFEVFGVGVSPPGGARFPDERGRDRGRDASPTDARVVILSPSLCRSLFADCSDAIGTEVRLDGETYLVSGVTVEGFDIPFGTELFVPLVFTPNQLADDFRGNEFLFQFARLGDGASLEQAQAEVELIAQSVLERVPERRDFLARNDWGASVVPLSEQLIGEFRPTLTLVWGAVALVLLVTAANVANLLLASAAWRSQEMAVRASLGASRGRILAQLVTESVLMTLCAVALGLVFARGLQSIVPRLVPHDLPRIETLSLDGRAILLQVVIALVLGVAFGFALTWRATSGRSGILSGTRSTEPRSAGLLRRGLVANEIAVAFVLVAGAALLFETYQELTALDPGFRTEGRAAFRLTLPRALYPDREDRVRFAETLLDRVRSLPGVRHAAAADRLPLDGQTWTGTFYPEGYVPAAGEPTPGADWNIVSRDYFETLGIPLLSGRVFEDVDHADAPRVAMVDEWMADTFWPGGAVGQRINLNDPLDEEPNWLVVVGVVGHVKYERLDEPGRMQMYVPLSQSALRSMTFAVLADADPLALIDAVQREQKNFAPDVPLYRVQTLDAQFASAVALRKFNLSMLSGFAGAAFLLAGIGIFGLLSYSVARRRRELGVRMALGASGRSIVRMVLKEGLVLVAFGVSLGLLATLGLTRFVASLLFGVRPNDIATLAWSAAALAALALVAAIVPARRAARLDPAVALRVD